MGDETAIVKFEGRAGLLVERAKSFHISDENTRKEAAEFSQEIRTYIKAVEDFCDPGIKAAHTTHKLLTTQKKELIDRAKPAKDIVDNEIKRDYLMVSGTQAEAEELLRLQAEKKMAETGLWEPTLVLPQIDKTIRTDGGGSINIRKDIKVTPISIQAVVDAAAQHKIPYILLKVDEGAAKRYAKSAGLTSMDGFIIEEDAVVSGRK